MARGERARADPDPLALARIEARVRDYDPDLTTFASGRQRASVAAILRGPPVEVLLIERATTPGGRWSGQVAFPGGRAEVHDANSLATAIRETREEVGIDLSKTARVLGRSDDQMAMAKGKVLPMVISPFVFVQTEPSVVTLNAEAESSFWLPLDAVLGGGLDGTMRYSLGPVPIDLPCWRYDGYMVWGLTHRMISRLLQIISPP